MAVFIRKIVHYLYKFFHLQKTIPESIFMYSFCGGMNVLFGWFLYFVIYNFIISHRLIYFYIPFFYLSPICISPHIFTLIVVFPITLFIGFWLNKYVVFSQSSLKTTKQLFRYVLIIFINLFINYAGMKLLVDICHFYPTPSNMVVTLFTILLSYFWQKYVSFK